MIEEKRIRFTIPLTPITKKNHQQIVWLKGKGRPIVIPSPQYKKYEKDTIRYIPKMCDPLSFPVRVECKFFMPTRRRCDLTNLLEAIDDILVKAGLLADDNYTVIESHDGSRVLYDKEHPRTEIIITKVKPQPEAMADEDQKERSEIAEILSDSFTLEKYDVSDFEWCAYQLQVAGYHKKKKEEQ